MVSCLVCLVANPFAVKANGNSYSTINNDIEIYKSTLFEEAKNLANDITQVQKRNILIEEYTGKGCGNCPRGAQMIKDFQELLGDRIHSVAVHAGSYAEPGSGPDYRTQIGDSLLANVGNIGFPAATINRRQFDVTTDYELYTNEWTKASKKIYNQTAEVNIELNANINAKTNVLTVNVEAYYTSTPTVNDLNFLTVALMQNHIIGPQNSGGENYSHEHMLRAYLTPLWGDTIKNPAMGVRIEKVYTYTIPENYRDIETDIRNMEIVVFINEGKRGVLNVNSCKVEVLEFTEPVNAKISAKPINKEYCYNYFPIEVQNLCNDTITEILFSSDINGVRSDITYNETRIPPYETYVINVDVNEYEIKPQSNTVKFELQKVNNRDVSASTVEFEFSGARKGSENIYLELKTDMCGDEISWVLLDRNGNIIQESDEFEAGVAKIVKDTIIIEEEGIYSIEFRDMWIDGWKEGNNGYYKLLNSNGILLGQNYAIAGRGDLIVFNVLTATSTEEIEANIANTITVYPNPVKDILNVNIEANKPESIKVFIRNISGIKLLEVANTLVVGKNSIQIDMSALQSGVYIICIEGKENKFYKKIIKL